MAESVTVIPAYGRDYKTRKALVEAWESGLDFLINDVSSESNGQLINREDAMKGGITEIRAYYDDPRLDLAPDLPWPAIPLVKVAIIKVK